MANVPLVDLRAQYEPIKEEVHQAWDEILASMRLFLGPNVQAFEKEFAAFCGTADSIGISDGTTAIHLALRACGVGPGDEVISVSHTFIATFEAIALVGARPVFVDIDPKTCLMDVSQIEAKITPRTKAILPVHLYGQCVDMDPLMAIAKKHNLFVIEDACQAHGAEYKGKKAGSIGTMGCFSFYFSKNLGAYGEGGMVTTNDLALAKRVRILRDHGSEKRYYHDEVGINGRLDEMQAAVLRIKLRRLAGWNEQRRVNAALFNQLLAGTGVATPYESPDCKHIYHLYVIRSSKRDALRDHLNAQGVGTGIHYPVPIHLQKAAAYLGYKVGDFPETEKAVGEILSLPMYAELTAEQVKTVADEVKKFLAT